MEERIRIINNTLIYHFKKLKILQKNANQTEQKWMILLMQWCVIEAMRWEMSGKRQITQEIGKDTLKIPFNIKY
ncbi:MAG: hypothetical protein CM15mP65_22580 [Crocinitomicaceae bacterium]|nr:MAG: hypothetical protein CM15mP65_22580 [Crocinitomicaceae bacterium]